MKDVFKFLVHYACAVLACLYIFTIGLFFGKGRDLIVRMYRIFFWSILPAPRTIIPRVEPSTVIPRHITDIELYEELPRDGNVSTLELVVIVKLIRAYHPETIFEIGTFNGRTTLNMAANCPPKAKVYTLDMVPEKRASAKLPLSLGDRQYIAKDSPGSSFLGTACAGKIIQLYGDSATFNFTPFFNTVDFIFVDGSHSYGYTLNDSTVALRLLRDGKGIIVWHDYGAWGGVTKALNEAYLNRKECRGLQHIVGTSLVYVAINRSINISPH